MNRIKELLAVSPIIAAVKDGESVELAVKSDCDVVFTLFGSICDIGEIVRKIKDAGKICFVHADLVEGLALKETAARFIKENTAAYINVIKKNPVDVITHLNYCCFANAAEVAKAAADYGTYIELNAKKVHLTDEELYAVEKTGVNFVIGSDAHTPDRVGEISLVKKMLERVNIPEERIMNVNGRTPDFRFKKFKENAGR